jgi:predicted DNA-binding transcriptional regulator YafY
MAKARSDADRRTRQCERYARLLRITRLVMGHGRWGPDDLAREVGCSVRTVHRDIQVLSMSGVPIYWDRACEAYRVREGFRFPGLEPRPGDRTEDDARDLLQLARGFLAAGEDLLAAVRELCERLESCRQYPDGG